MGIESVMLKHEKELMMLPNAQGVCISVNGGKKAITVIVDKLDPALESDVNRMRQQMEGYDLKYDLKKKPGRIQ